MSLASLWVRRPDHLLALLADLEHLEGQPRVWVNVFHASGHVPVANLLAADLARLSTPLHQGRAPRAQAAFACLAEAGPCADSGDRP